jgi:hypothetical protein
MVSGENGCRSHEAKDEQRVWKEHGLGGPCMFYEKAVRDE